MQRAVDAEKSDIFDVLAYVAYARAPHTRTERAAHARASLDGKYDDKLRGFLEFVLDAYEREGVHELDSEKLAPLLRRRYDDSLNDALRDLGREDVVRQAFTGFQQHLYVGL
jgi:type I restriction enzyme R subunit